MSGRAHPRTLHILDICQLKDCRYVRCQDIFKARQLENLLTFYVEAMFKNISRTQLSKSLQVYVLRINGHIKPF
jgi:hypothetical protein